MAEKILHTMLGGLRPQVEHRGEIVVIGLGRFGSALASTLIEMGHEVLGIDADEERVQVHADLLTHVAQADTTNERTLRQLGVADVVTAVVAIGLVVGATLVLMSVEDFALTPALFEITSAFGTVGLSTGITATIGASGHILLVLVMLAGRVGPVTFVTALALRERVPAYRYPEERPIIG